MTATTPLYIGCAGWSLPRDHWEAFPTAGTHLQRYAARMTCVEINSSFYRPHRPATYARWAESVPERFRFSVKVPKQITHEARLLGCEQLIDEFIGQCSHLGQKLGCLLIQLPPSLAFEGETAQHFFSVFRSRYDGFAVLEPRHVSWQTPQAQTLLIEHRIGQVAADPSPIPEGDVPGAWPGIRYFRLHGSPRIYYSSYESPWLEELAITLQPQAQDRPTWCIFDNTASGAATANALELQHLASPST
ncbi:DUF72 domain-containing protein [Pseudomonas sp. IT-P294]|uniref:DUF72 domain-containing protein n=1 Tax=Pseudomonas sp. IT-P294 TaxID=3026454 RepID=UPI0039E00EBF